jgi:hypothetical protein
MEKKKIEEMNETELKALAYECVVMIEQARNTLTMVNQQLSKEKKA